MHTERVAALKAFHEESRAQRPEELPEFDEALNAMTSAERAITARLAIDVGEKVREAREAAGLSQRELAVRMSTSQAAVARLEAGGTSATLTTLQKAAAALGLELTIDLAPAH